MTIEIEYRPRPEYGLICARSCRAVDGGVTARGGAEWLVLTSPGPAERRRLDRDGAVHGARPARRCISGCTARRWRRRPPASGPRTSWRHRLDATVDAWRSWSDLHQTYDGPWRDLVHHSGRVLQALSFQPSGAIVAAATTSLPEGVGGERNWDYRYSWVRDASLTMEALWVAACPDEASDFFAFLTTAAAAVARARTGRCRSCSASAASTT